MLANMRMSTRRCPLSYCLWYGNTCSLGLKEIEFVRFPHTMHLKVSEAPCSRADRIRKFKNNLRFQWYGFVTLGNLFNLGFCFLNSYMESDMLREWLPGRVVASESASLVTWQNGPGQGCFQGLLKLQPIQSQQHGVQNIYTFKLSSWSDKNK